MRARSERLPLDNMTTETHITTLKSIPAFSSAAEAAAAVATTGKGIDAQRELQRSATTTVDYSASEVSTYPSGGAYVHGLYVQGARWAAEGVPPAKVDGVECAGTLAESRLKELLPALPVIYVRAVVVSHSRIHSLSLPSYPSHAPPGSHHCPVTALDGYWLLDITTNHQSMQVQPSWAPTSVGYLRPEEDIYNAPVYLTEFRGPTYVFAATLRTETGSARWVLAGVALLMQSSAA